MPILSDFIKVIIIQLSSVMFSHQMGAQGQKLNQNETTHTQLE